MAEKMRIGELLLLQEKIDPWVLSHTLKEQAHSRLRLVSLLVKRAQLDPDDGALVLSEQLGFPAAMQRHLERLDDAVLELLPPELGGRWVVLPLRRARTGQVIVVARDPTPILAAALEHAMKTPVILSVTPSVQLERLVRAAYGASMPPVSAEEEPLPSVPPTLSDIGSLTLDDKTPAPVPSRRPRTVSGMFDGPLELRAPTPVSPVDELTQEIRRAGSAAAVERLVMAYIARRWTSALLMRVEGTRAHGLRGHGPRIHDPEAITIPLAPISTLSLAYDTRHASTDQPASSTQALLRDVLGTAAAPGSPIVGGPITAVPVLAGGTVTAVLVLGDRLDVGGTSSEVDQLVDLLGTAYERFAR